MGSRLDFSPFVFGFLHGAIFEPEAVISGLQDMAVVGEAIEERGGMSTKIHAVVDALGNPLRFILTPGQVSDITQAEELIAGLPADHVLADKGYDLKALRETIVKQDAAPVIPPRKTSPQVTL